MKSSTFELSLVIYIHHEYLLNYSTLIMRRVLGSSAQRSTSLSRLIESVKSLSRPRVMKSLSLILYNKDNLSVYNIRKRYCATLLSFFKKAQYRTCLDIRDMSYSCCYHDQARGFHGALRKHSS